MGKARWRASRSAPPSTGPSGRAGRPARRWTAAKPARPAACAQPSTERRTPRENRAGSAASAAQRPVPAPRAPRTHGVTTIAGVSARPSRSSRPTCRRARARRAARVDAQPQVPVAPAPPGDRRPRLGNELRRRPRGGGHARARPQVALGPIPAAATADRHGRGPRAGSTARRRRPSAFRTGRDAPPKYGSGRSVTILGRPGDRSAPARPRGGAPGCGQVADEHERLAGPKPRQPDPLDAPPRLVVPGVRAGDRQPGCVGEGEPLEGDRSRRSKAPPSWAKGWRLTAATDRPGRGHSGSPWPSTRSTGIAHPVHASGSASLAGSSRSIPSGSRVRACGPRARPRLVSCPKGSWTRSLDAGEDLVGGLDPAERAWILVVGLQVQADRVLELARAAVNTTRQLLACQFGEPPLHLVDPGRVRWREVEVEPSVPDEPTLHRWRLVRAERVEHHVHLKVGWHLSIDVIEEGAELHRTMAATDLGPHLARRHHESGRQRRRAVAPVVETAPLRVARPHRQHWLRAIQRLDLRLLVDAHNRHLVGRAQVEPDDVPDLLHHLRVSGQSEGLAAVRLEPEGAPDSMHPGSAQAGLRGETPEAPTGRVSRGRLQRANHR